SLSSPSRLLVSTPPASSLTLPLSLHDALPIYQNDRDRQSLPRAGDDLRAGPAQDQTAQLGPFAHPVGRSGVTQHLVDTAHPFDRSEEHTSELQSRFDLVCRLLLEKKKKAQHTA